MARKKMQKNELLDKRVFFRLDSERYQLLEAYAWKKGCNVSSLIRQMVIVLLEDQRRLGVL